jgi:phage terminase large subunit-like protein
MVEYPQTVPNLTAASQNLYELIKAQSITVYPDDEIRLAISRAVAVESTRGWRIAKDKQSHKIDIVVALAMAALGAVRKGGAQIWINGKTAEQMQEHLARVRQNRSVPRYPLRARPEPRVRDTIRVKHVSESDIEAAGIRLEW